MSTVTGSNLWEPEKTSTMIESNLWEPVMMSTVTR